MPIPAPESANARQWLCAALAARPLPVPMPTAETLIRSASQEGVLTLLADCLPQHPQYMQLDPAMLARLQVRAKIAAHRSLQQQAGLVRVYQALQAAGIRFLVLKGAALAYWLYAQPHHRLITDIDLLVADRAQAQRALAALQPLGYQPCTALAEVHDQEWAFFHADALTVDLHWDLFNSSLLSGRFSFAELWAERLSLPGLPGVHALGPVHALINACGHRASNLPYAGARGVQRADCLRWLWDVHVLAESLSTGQWQQLCAMAADKRLSTVLAEALDTCSTHFASTLPPAMIARLTQQAKQEPMHIGWFRSWWRYQFYRVYFSHPHWRGRLRYLAWRIWPSAKGLRNRYGAPGQAGWWIKLRRLGYGIRQLFGGQS